MKKGINRGSRICTTKGGDRYLVQQIDFRTRKVFCWGEVVSYKGNQRTHASSKVFNLDEVTVEEITVTPVITEELFQQSVRKIKENGDLVRSHARNGRELKTVITKPGASHRL